MKKDASTLLLLIVAFLVIFLISGCSIFNNVPEKYTEGIKIARDYPDDILLIYDDSIVFECDTHFDEIVLSCGTEDDLDDIIDFYKDFFKENNITLDKEDEDRDEYYAKAINGDYRIKIEVVEADGEYVEDLYENVIYLSVEELDEATKQSLAATPEPLLEETPEKEYADNHSPKAEDDISQVTSLTELSTGSWTLTESVGDPGMHRTDFNLEIVDDTNGIMYYFNKSTDINAWVNFTYEIVDGTLLLYQKGNAMLRFEAYYYDDVLHLINLDSPTEEYYLVQFNRMYNIYPSKDSFTAYGSWIYYNPDNGYIDSISLWEDEDGLIYNFFGNYTEERIAYEYADGDIMLCFDNNETFCLHASHYGNILELTDQDGNTFPYNRAETSWLTGTYSLINSSDETITDWVLTINEDHSASFILTSNDKKHEEPDSTWYISPRDGKLNIMNNGEFFGFYYHFNGTGMIIYDPDNHITIELTKTR